MGALPLKPLRESLHRLKLFLIYPPSIARNFRFRVRKSHSINKVVTRITIPTVTPTMVGTFEEELEDRTEAEFDGCDDDRVIVEVCELVGDMTLVRVRQDVLVPLRTKKYRGVGTIEIFAISEYHP